MASSVHSGQRGQPQQQQTFQGSGYNPQMYNYGSNEGDAYNMNTVNSRNSWQQPEQPPQADNSFQGEPYQPEVGQDQFNTTGNTTLPTTDTTPKKKTVPKSSSSWFSWKPKKLPCEVIMLDGEILTLELDKKSTGLALFSAVADSLKLTERDYFGLYRNEVVENGIIRNWVRMDKKITAQLKGADAKFWFGVKFFTPDPLELLTDLSRYQVCLQIRNDIVSKYLPCSFLTLALLGAYSVQAELGDWNQEECGDGYEYLRGMTFAPEDTDELLTKIVEFHKNNSGQTPAQADIHFLENARKIATYGIEFYPAQDDEGVLLQIGLGSSGIVVYWRDLRVNKFSWPKVLKMSYKNNVFFIRVKASEFEKFESIIGFHCRTNQLAKMLWRSAVEHHIFWRLKLPEPENQFTSFLGFGGSKRYRLSTRTFSEARRAVPRDAAGGDFERMESKRRSAASSRQSDAQAALQPSMNARANISPPQSRRHYDQRPVYDTGQPSAYDGLERGAPTGGAMAQTTSASSFPANYRAPSADALDL